MLENEEEKESLLPHNEDIIKNTYNQDEFIQKQEQIKSKYTVKPSIFDMAPFVAFIIAFSHQMFMILYDLNIINQCDIHFSNQDYCFSDYKRCSIGILYIMFINIVIVGLLTLLANISLITDVYRPIDEYRKYKIDNQDEVIETTLSDGTIIYRNKDILFYIVGKHRMKKDSSYFNNPSTFSLQYVNEDYYFFEKKIINRIPTVDELNAPYIIDEVKMDILFRRFLIFRKIILIIPWILTFLMVILFGWEIISYINNTY